MQGTSAAGTGYGGASGYGQSGYGSTAQAADTSSNFGGNMGTSGYGNDTSGYGSSAYGQVSPLTRWLARALHEPSAGLKTHLKPKQRRSQRSCKAGQIDLCD